MRSCSTTPWAGHGYNITSYFNCRNNNSSHSITYNRDVSQVTVLHLPNVLDRNVLYCARDRALPLVLLHDIFHTCLPWYSSFYLYPSRYTYVPVVQHKVQRQHFISFSITSSHVALHSQETQQSLVYTDLACLLRHRAVHMQWTTYTYYFAYLYCVCELRCTLIWVLITKITWIRYGVLLST